MLFKGHFWYLLAKTFLSGTGILYICLFLYQIACIGKLNFDYCISIVLEDKELC